MENSLQAYNSAQKIAHWTQRVKERRESGKTVQRWCEENGVSSKTFYYWQRKLYSFVMHSPLYRIEQDLNRKGIRLSRQTMSNWLIRCAKDWLKPVYDELKKELVGHDIIHADETTVQVLHEPGKKP